MKIIDLLVKISKGEEVPKKIRIDHWRYKFEWAEDLDNYYDNSADTDLMSALSMSKEELNYGVEIIEEEKKIKLPEQLRTWRSTEGNFDRSRRWIDVNAEQYYEKINEILAYLKYKEEESK